MGVLYVYDVSENELMRFAELLGDFMVGVLPGPRIVVKRPINGYKLNAIIADDAYVTNVHHAPKVTLINGLYEPNEGDLFIFFSNDLLYIDKGYPVYIRRAFKVINSQPIFTVDGYIKIKSLGLDPKDVALRISKMLEELRRKITS